MQGTYRIFADPPALIESFVAAPGPAGWRYFGRFHRMGSEEDVMTIDYVLDRQWDLVRFRATLASGERVVAAPGEEGLEVVVATADGRSSESIAGATQVWSPSPCSMLVADRRLRSKGESSFVAVRLEPPFRPQVVQVRFERRGSRRVNTPGGGTAAEEVDLFLDDRRLKALVRPDLPLFAEGWFELAG